MVSVLVSGTLPFCWVVRVAVSFKLVELLSLLLREDKESSDISLPDGSDTEVSLELVSRELVSNSFAIVSGIYR